MPVGQATLNFGVIDSPSSFASVDVTGQASIVATSKVEAWIRREATTEHSVDEIDAESQCLHVTVGNIVAGTGFTIYGAVLNGKTYGSFTVDWVWV